MANVRAHVIDALSRQQTRQLAQIAEAILERVDPDGVMFPRDDPARRA